MGLPVNNHCWRWKNIPNTCDKWRKSKSASVTVRRSTRLKPLMGSLHAAVGPAERQFLSPAVGAGVPQGRWGVGCPSQVGDQNWWFFSGVPRKWLINHQLVLKMLKNWLLLKIVNKLDDLGVNYQLLRVIPWLISSSLTIGQTWFMNLLLDNVLFLAYILRPISCRHRHGGAPLWLVSWFESWLILC